MSLRGKTMLITGASRGIGKAIAMRAARDGANIVVAAKTTEPHARLPGTIHSAVTEIEAAGGHALACCTDIRFEDQVEAAVDATIEEFGGIDIVVNNASAISLTDTVDTTMKRFDLMHSVNVRGTYMVTKACLASLEQGNNPHVLNIAPPLNLEPRWFGPHVAYTMSKYGMSMCVLGMSEEFRGRGVAVNALWPATVIATAAVRNLLGGESMIQRCRKPEIMGEAAYAILNRDCRACSGNFYTDEQILGEEGVTDFTPYAVNPAEEVLPDFFV